MHCTACKHSWCWVCGLPTSHWSHKFSDTLPFSCKTVPKTQIGWVGYFLLFLVGYILLPLFIFIVANMCTFWLVFRCICRTTYFRKPFRYGVTLKKILIFIFLQLPVYILLSAVSLVIGVPFGALCVGILTLPVYVFHTYYFIRSCIWWSKRSRV